MDCVHYAFECDGLCALFVWMRWTACIVRLNAMDWVHCEFECDGLRALRVRMRRQLAFLLQESFIQRRDRKKMSLIEKLK